MPDITYLTHTSLFLAVLYGSYWLLLRRETFHRLNRWLLLGTMIAVLVLPLLPAPVLFPAVQQNLDAGRELVVTTFWSADEQAGMELAATEPARPERPAYAGWLEAVYLGGLALFMVRLLVQLLWVLVILARARKEKTEEGWLLHSESTEVPFSFGPFIVLPEDLEEGALRSHILAHERAHCRQWHTLDILLAEMFSALLWFHPFAWWLKRSLRLQLEHLADAAALKKTNDRTAYQYSLLQVATRQPLSGLTNSFNQSIIKTRIVMINAKKSPDRYKLKYFIPALLAFAMLLAFNPADAQAVEQSTTKKGISAGSTGESNVAVGISSGTTGKSSARSGQSVGIGSSAGLRADSGESVFVVIGAKFPVERLPKMKEHLKKEGVLLSVDQLEYNEDKLITNIKLSVKTTDGKMHGSGSSYNDGAPIEEPVVFYVHRTGADYSFGIFTGKKDKNIPPEVQQVLAELKNGYFVGKVVQGR